MTNENGSKKQEYQIMIMGLKNRFHYIEYPHIGCCLSCSAIFNLMLRAYILEKQGVYLVYSGITCPCCNAVLAIMQEWAIANIDAHSLKSDFMYNNITQQVPYPNLTN